MAAPKNSNPSSVIETAYEALAGGKVPSLTSREGKAVLAAIQSLDQGKIRVCEKRGAEWVTHAWIKKAILLYFRMQKVTVSRAGELSFADKIPVKKWTPKHGVRVVPPAVARFGAYIESGAILMPSYVNIGARVGAGTMVDTWATVGSCAQVGQNVHLSGGVGIGGVLEPIQASPVIIEDGAFVGSRCIVVEGVVVEEGAVLGAGVTLTSSTKIIDAQTGKELPRGRIPARSVVIPGSVDRTFAGGTFGVPCALIIGQRSAQTDLKTSLTSVLRDFQVSV